MNKLREATRQLHEEIEKENLAGLIMSNEIEMEEYKLLLLQNFVAYNITEAEISGQLEEYESTKSARLQEDLNQLGVETSIVNHYRDQFKCAGKAEAIGAAYVIEGSALGGAMIAREIKNCENLAPALHHNFFSENNELNGWKIYKKNLKEINLTEEEEQQAITKAMETFKFFGRVFREVRLQE